MDKTILTVFKIISLVFIALAVTFQIVVLIKGEDGLVGTSTLDNYIILAYVAVGLTAFFAFLFPVILLVQNPKNALKLLGVLVVLVVIGFICYSVAKNTLGIEQLEQLKTTPETSKMVGASLYFTYIIGSLTVLSVIYSSVSSYFK
ncbi:MAG: hypothetical protein B6D61_07995 [Bacteroidetes bacterium 4484_249]|nr:MAG: hypothetical protein B6D61_07995 [Bacteroidetes bacterium 4484_249]